MYPCVLKIYRNIDAKLACFGFFFFFSCVCCGRVDLKVTSMAELKCGEDEMERRGKGLEEV